MQARAEATRRLIVDCAVNLFDTVGYANASLADLIGATGVSKGAFYYHFVNREAVTEAIILEADALLRNSTVQHLSDTSSPALEGLIRSIFAGAELTRTNPLVRVGIQFRGGVGQLSSALEGFTEHRELFVNVVSVAVADGDLRSDVSVNQVAHALWSAILGTHQHCAATGEDLPTRLADVLTVILPAICAPDSVDRYGELVSQFTAGTAPATSGVSRNKLTACSVLCAW